MDAMDRLGATIHDRVETALGAVARLDDSPEARAYRHAVDASHRARAAYFAAKAA